MSNILQELESQIAGIKTAVTRSNVGVVREIGDGAAKVEGLSDVMLIEHGYRTYLLGKTMMQMISFIIKTNG